MLLTSFLHTRAKALLRTTSSTSVRTAARFDFVDGTNYEWQANQARFGRVATTYWNYKLAGRYMFPHKIGLTATYRLQSGFQVGRRITVRLPNAGTERVLADPYLGRAPNVGIFDLRGEKQLALRNGLSLTLLLDSFNVLNDVTVLNFRTISGPRYNEIIAILNPRVFRAGLRLEF